MSDSIQNGLGDLSMLELFRMEEQQQSSVLTEGLLALEQEPNSPKHLESLMRAAHSLKGAARMVGLDAVVDLTHVMEDCFVAAQKAELLLCANHIDILFGSIDLISKIAASDGVDIWLKKHQEKYDNQLVKLNGIQSSSPQIDECSIPKDNTDCAKEDAVNTVDAIASPSADPSGEEPAVIQNEPISKSDLRISSDQINRLMGLAGEAAEGSRWVRHFSESLLQLKRNQVELISTLDDIAEKAREQTPNEQIQEILHRAQSKAANCRNILGDRLTELDSFERRGTSVSKRLSQAVITSRMQPFGDGTGGFPRLVRDVARKLNKEVKLQTEGQGTLVDREILAKIEAPLNHLLRNAIDHGIEAPEIREALGKPRQGTINLSAYHMSGMLFIVISDDGQGVDLDRLRQKVLKKGLVNEDMPDKLSEEELLEFLFLPSFSTRDEVTEISGRGVGLDAVQDAVREMGGIIRTHSSWGKGTTFQLNLPLTLSVVPSLVVEIAGEPYAFPLARVHSILKANSKEIEVTEGHQFIDVGNQHVGLVNAAQILGFGASQTDTDTIAAVLLGDRKNPFGLVVDKLLGEQDLVVHVLPDRLGKIKDISAAAILEDGSPLLIINVDDILRSIEKAVISGRVDSVGNGDRVDSETGLKRVLVVDDSITVREVERNLLEAVGYEVEVAVDGMDGWHVINQSTFDLIITDIDMPRMDGIELVRQIKSKPSLRDIPVIIVSYKDREEDRQRGLEAGADHYLTKGSFQDNSLRNAVIDLIGEATV